MSTVSKFVVVAAAAFCGAGAIYYKLQKTSRLKSVFSDSNVYQKEEELGPGKQKRGSVSSNHEADSDDDSDSDDDRIYEKYFRIPGSVVGAVIGRHGKTLRKIEAETMTNCMVLSCTRDQFSRAKNSNSEDTSGWANLKNQEKDWFAEEDKNELDDVKFVLVSANSLQKIELARLRLKEVISSSINSHHYDTFSVSKVFTGFMIGKNGQNIRRLQAKYAVHIQVNDDEENTENVVVKIRGRDMNSVTEAKMELEYCCQKDQIEKPKTWKRGLTDDVQEEMELLLKASNELSKPEEEYW